MRARDVVGALASKLPLLVDDFTSNVLISSLTCAGTTVTATTATPHGIPVGEIVGIVGASTPISIDSFTRLGGFGTIITSEDHDLTLSTRVPADTSVSVDGSVEQEFNGDFTVVAVNNRRKITVEMDDSGPNVATGTPLLYGASGCFAEYNGAHEVLTVPTDTAFTYEVPKTLFSPALLDAAQVRRAARIVPTVSIERVIDLYSDKAQVDPWLFVVLGDSTASKSRKQENDSVSNNQRQGYVRQQIMQDVNVYAMVPASDDMDAADARDFCEDLTLPICQSILMRRFDTTLTIKENNPLQFVSSGFTLYSRAYYMHGYTFQQVADMSSGDTVGPDCDVAFRDISLAMMPNTGNGTIDTQIDLDDEPLT